MDVFVVVAVDSVLGEVSIAVDSVVCDDAVFGFDGDVSGSVGLAVVVFAASAVVIALVVVGTGVVADVV